MDANVVVAAGSTPLGAFDDGATDEGQTVISNNIVGYIAAPTDILDPLNGYAAKTITGCQNQSAIWNTTYDRTTIGCAASNLIVIGNKISNALGVVFNPVEENILIANNIVDNATGAGCYIQSNEVTVSDNIFRNVGSDTLLTFSNRIEGIGLFGDNENVNISGNKILTSGGEAIVCGADADRVVIENNYIEGSGANASIYLNGAGSPGTVNKVSVLNNVIKGVTALRGIWARSVDDLTIISNIVEDSSDGIRADACGDVIVSMNRVDTVTADGVRVSGTTASAAVIGNTVNSAVRGTVTDATVVLVTAYGNIGTNCSGSTFSIFASGTLKPTVAGDANI